MTSAAYSRFFCTLGAIWESPPFSLSVPELLPLLNASLNITTKGGARLVHSAPDGNRTRMPSKDTRLEPGTSSYSDTGANLTSSLTYRIQRGLSTDRTTIPWLRYITTKHLRHYSQLHPVTIVGSSYLN